MASNLYKPKIISKMISGNWYQKFVNKHLPTDLVAKKLQTGIKIISRRKYREEFVTIPTKSV